MNVCRVLPNGTAAKAAVDQAIDICTPIGGALCPTPTSNYPLSHNVSPHVSSYHVLQHPVRFYSWK